MIGFLKGRLFSKQPPHLVVDVNGVGYELEAPMSTFYGLPGTGEAVALFTHLVVREDAHILFAFGTDGERRLFRALIKISGVGPKIALGILSGSNVEDFLRTIETEDSAALTRIPGIGRKTAERIVIEMRDGAKKLAAGQAGSRERAGLRGCRDCAERSLRRLVGARLQAARGDEAPEGRGRARAVDDRIDPPRAESGREVPMNGGWQTEAAWA